LPGWSRRPFVGRLGAGQRRSAPASPRQEQPSIGGLRFVLSPIRSPHDSIGPPTEEPSAQCCADKPQATPPGHLQTPASAGFSFSGWALRQAASHLPLRRGLFFWPVAAWEVVMGEPVSTSAGVVAVAGAAGLGIAGFIAGI